MGAASKKAGVQGLSPGMCLRRTGHLRNNTKLVLFLGKCACVCLSICLFVQQKKSLESVPEIILYKIFPRALAWGREVCPWAGHVMDGHAKVKDTAQDVAQDVAEDFLGTGRGGRGGREGAYLLLRHLPVAEPAPNTRVPPPKTFP